MKNLRFLLATFFAAALALPSLDAQADSLQRQINEQVWKPFLESFGSGDQQKFMSVHHPEVLRVMEDDNALLTHAEYFRDALSGKKQEQKSDAKRELELRFTRRIATPENAFEVGYYKGTVTKPDGKVRNYYGKFHVVLKKQDGVWKIWLDSDTGEGANEAAFLAADAMEGK